MNTGRVQRTGLEKHFQTAPRHVDVQGHLAVCVRGANVPITSSQGHTRTSSYSFNNMNSK